jgi:protein-tyrosine phosphatase
LLIDIHCHILPGLDDGAQGMEESVAMARQAAEEGIRTIIATPHHRDGRYDNAASKVLESVRQLNEKLTEASIPVSILPGQEIHIFGELANELTGTELLTLTDESPYVLVELPSSHVPRYTEQLLFDIQLKGFIPIIAHPERNQEIMENPDKLYKLVDKGAYSQVTALSVAGGFGKKIQKFSLSLLEHNLAHFIASDAHHVKTRPFKMKQALETVEKKFGNVMVHQLVENGELLAEGQTAFKDRPHRIKKKKVLGLF